MLKSYFDQNYENIDHLGSRYAILEPDEYMKCNVISWQIGPVSELENLPIFLSYQNRSFYKQKPEPIVEYKVTYLIICWTKKCS